jgi:hypothetical protein
MLMGKTAASAFVASGIRLLMPVYAKFIEVLLFLRFIYIQYGPHNRQEQNYQYPYEFIVTFKPVGQDADKGNERENHKKGNNHQDNDQFPWSVAPSAVQRLANLSFKFNF